MSTWGYPESPLSKKKKKKKGGKMPVIPEGLQTDVQVVQTQKPD